jgi:two-component system response regulator ResD
MNHSLRVLVVDDEPDVRTVVGLNLDLAGMEHGEAGDGAEAIDMLNSGSWNACILDLGLPDVDGLSVLQDLTESGRINDMSVVVLSARGSPESAVQAMQLGAHAHLTKPFSPASVARLVQELMELTAEDRAARRTEGIDRAVELERLGMTTI